MTPAALLALLGTPALWLCTSLAPPTVCQPAAGVCLVQAPHGLLATRTDGGISAETVPLTGPVALVARNLVVLRVVDAEMLARDRAAQGLRERARRSVGG